MPTTSIFEQNIHFIFAFKTYSESDDKSDLKEYPKLSNFLIYRSFTKCNHNISVLLRHILFYTFLIFF